jgi:hypothetical protein
MGSWALPQGLSVKVLQWIVASVKKAIEMHQAA